MRLQIMVAEPTAHLPDYSGFRDRGLKKLELGTTVYDVLSSLLLCLYTAQPSHDRRQPLKHSAEAFNPP